MRVFFRNGFHMCSRKMLVPNLESVPQLQRRSAKVSGGSSASGVENKRLFRTKPAISALDAMSHVVAQTILYVWWNCGPFPGFKT